METLNEKILKSIQEDLPAATAGELSKFIENAKKIEKELQSVKDTNASYLAELSGLQKQQQVFMTASRKEEAALDALKQAEDKLRKYDLDIKDEQIKQRDFVINKFDNFLSLLVKNPRAIEMIAETRNVPVWETYSGGGGYHVTKPEFTSGQVEKTETKD